MSEPSNAAGVTDAPREHTVSRTTTEVGNKVVPHQRAVTFATQQWLVKLHKHLTAFVARPSDGRHLARLEFPVGELGSLQTNFVDSFEITAKLDAEPAEVRIDYIYRGSKSLTRVPSTKEAYFALRALLNKHGLVHKSAISSTVAKVQLEPIIPAQMRFTIELKDAAINAEFRNVDGLGVVTHTLSPHDCGTDLLHAVEDMILGDPNKFYRRSTGLVPREERIELSRKLSQSEKLKVEERLPSANPKPTFFGKLKRAIKKH